jgi:hypothetical protein
MYSTAASFWGFVKLLRKRGVFGKSQARIFLNVVCRIADQG